MKSSTFVLLLSALFVAAPVAVFGQGGNNPTGTFGEFNGNSTTGCSYDPFTGNATRTIVDLAVTGAVGAYPLAWTRTMNSRDTGGGHLGGGGSWRESYRWAESLGTYLPAQAIPASYTITYPDGRQIIFSGNGGIYLGPSRHQ